MERNLVFARGWLKAFHAVQFARRKQALCYSGLLVFSYGSNSGSTINGFNASYAIYRQAIQ